MKTVFLLIIILAVVSFLAGYQFGASRPLTLTERRNIAIEYACSPDQNWRMMKFFCGSVK